MRGKRAKAIRKIVYGELPFRTRNERNYLQIKRGAGNIIFNDPKSPRSRYLRIKAAYRAGLVKFTLSKGRKAACGY